MYTDAVVARGLTSLGPAWTLLLAGVALKVFIVFWIRADAKSRGVDPIPWMVAAAAFDLLTLVVWAFARRSRTPS